MSFTFSQLQFEVKRRGTRDQGGTQFDQAIKNLINTSLLRVAREAPWKPLRRKDKFSTEAIYSTGTVDATNGLNSYAGAGKLLITNQIRIGRRINIAGTAQNLVITTITGEETFTTNLIYSGTTATGLTYQILGTEEYNLPIQAPPQRFFLWHEGFGFPYVLEYITDLTFYSSNISLKVSAVPTHYRAWTDNMVIRQVLSPSVMRIFSSVSTDTSKNVTIFGVVSGYPDFETIATNPVNGTTPVLGLKTFSSVERVVRDSSSTGRLTVDANSGNTLVATLPVGDSINGIMYPKVQLFPLPNTVFDVNVQYYKDPWFLVNDQDVHEIGGDFDEAIILLATAKLKYESNQTEGDKFFGLYQDELRILRRVNVDKIDWLPRLERPKDSRINRSKLSRFLIYPQLGGNYGPMSRL